jgi:hypothetical protein
MVCLAASAAAIYSASDDDVAVMGCLLLGQLTGPLASMKTLTMSKFNTNEKRVEEEEINN